MTLGGKKSPFQRFSCIHLYSGTCLTEERESEETTQINSPPQDGSHGNGNYDLCVALAIFHQLVRPPPTHPVLGTDVQEIPNLTIPDFVPPLGARVFLQALLAQGGMQDISSSVGYSLDVSPNNTRICLSSLSLKTPYYNSHGKTWLRQSTAPKDKLLHVFCLSPGSAEKA